MRAGRDLKSLAQSSCELCAVTSWRDVTGRSLCLNWERTTANGKKKKQHHKPKMTFEAGTTQKSCPSLENLRQELESHWDWGSCVTRTFQRKQFYLGKQSWNLESSLSNGTRRTNVFCFVLGLSFPWEQLGFPHVIPFSWFHLFRHHLCFPSFSCERRAPWTAPSSPCETQTVPTSQCGAVPWSRHSGEGIEEPAGICTCGDAESSPV